MELTLDMCAKCACIVKLLDPKGRMPERGLTFNPGFNSGTKLVPMPDSSLKLVRMPEGRLTLDPGLALWTKAQKLVLLQGRISDGLAPKVSVL